MSDEEPTDKQPQTKPKHAGGRPRKPVPAPPPAPNSLEETISLGDQAALSANPAGKLRWYSHRAELVKDIQARAAAERHDTLQSANEVLSAKLEALEKEKQDCKEELTTKDADLLEARTDNEKLRREMKEITDGHNKESAELTKKTDAAIRRTRGLLAVVRYGTLLMKDLSQTDRIEYAARLMDFSLEQMDLVERLQKLVRNPADHEKHYASWRDRPLGAMLRLNPKALEQQRVQDDLMIANQLEADRESLQAACSNIIPVDLMDEVFELLSVTSEQVRLRSAKWQERKLRS